MKKKMDEQITRLRALVEEECTKNMVTRINIDTRDQAHVIFLKWIVDATHDAYIHIEYSIAEDRGWVKKREKYLLLDKDGVKRLIVDPKGYVDVYFISKTLSQKEQRTALGLHPTCELLRYADVWIFYRTRSNPIPGACVV
jgi:hypothetical protein